MLYLPRHRVIEIDISLALFSSDLYEPLLHLHDLRPLKDFYGFALLALSPLLPIPPPSLTLSLSRCSKVHRFKSVRASVSSLASYRLFLHLYFLRFFEVISSLINLKSSYNLCSYFFVFHSDNPTEGFSLSSSHLRCSFYLLLFPSLSLLLTFLLRLSTSV